MERRRARSAGRRSGIDRSARDGADAGADGERNRPIGGMDGAARTDAVSVRGPGAPPGRPTGRCRRRTQPPQFGLRAKQTCRPCRISRSENRPRSSGGTSAFRSSSAFTGSVSVVSLRRRGEPAHVGVDRQTGEVERDRAHHVAGLASDAGQLHEVVELGGHLAAEVVLERARHAEQVLGLRPEEAGRRTRAARPRPGRRRRGRRASGTAANSAGVTLLTFSSVRLRRQDRRGQELERRSRGPARSRRPGTPAPGAPAPRRPRLRSAVGPSAEPTREVASPDPSTTYERRDVSAGCGVSRRARV